VVTDSVTLATRSRTAHAQALVGLAAVLLLGAIYWQTVWHMAQVWLDSVTFRHGLVIVPISAWLIWRRRRLLLQTPLQPNRWAACALAVPVAAWWLGRATDVSVVQEAAMVAMIPMLVTAVLGTAAFKILRFPLLYLFFAVPVGWFLVPPLMHVTAFFAVHGLQWSGIPVFQDGFRISVPTGDFLVANACSGIRYLIACLALGTLFAYLFYRSRWRRALFMALAFVVPVVANGIRAYGIILLAYLSDMRIATGFDHIIYGFIFFSVVLFLMFWLGSLFREDTEAAQHAAQETPGRRSPGSHTFGPVAIAAVVGVIIVALGPLAWAGVTAWGMQAPQVAAGALFTGGNAWQGPASVQGVWHPHFAGQHKQFAGGYRQAGRRVAVFVEAYAYPHEGKGVVSSLNRVTDNPHQLIDADEYRVANLDSAHPTLRVRQSIVQTRRGQRLVWSWYRVAGHSTANRVVEKLHEALRILRGGNGWAQWVSVSTPVNGGLAAAQKTLHSFLRDNYANLVTCLSETKASAGCAS